MGNIWHVDSFLDVASGVDALRILGRGGEQTKRLLIVNNSFQVLAVVSRKQIHTHSAWSESCVSAHVQAYLSRSVRKAAIKRYLAKKFLAFLSNVAFCIFIYGLRVDWVKPKHWPKPKP